MEAGPPAVVVTSRSFGNGRDAAAPLRARGLDVVRCGAAHDLDELRPALTRAVGWIAGTGTIGPAHLELAPGLRVIARYGVGVDSVDLAAAASRGVVVTNTPGANADAVADYALALLLAAVRHVAEGDRAVRAGDWSARLGRELSALTVGVVGFGRIGRAVAHRLVAGFGTRVVVFDPYVPDADVAALRCTPAPLAELVAEADAVTLHLPGGGAPLVDAGLLAHVRRGAILINTARADLLDEAAVVAALHDGTLSALAVDVLPTEHESESALLDAPNVLATPHLAAQTREAVDRMSTMAVAEVVHVLDGEPPLNPVHPPVLEGGNA